MFLFDKEAWKTPFFGLLRERPTPRPFVSLRKIGGLWFLKIGRITLMACVSRSLKPVTKFKPEDLLGMPQLKKRWDAEARRLHDDLAK